jgi:conjugal transfer pilus assembly protein TraE
MNFKSFINSWQGINAENKFHRLLLTVNSIALVIAVIGWQTKDRVTVVVPPTLNEKAEIALSSASIGYKKSWGLFVAELLGNITPSNVEFVVESLSSMMTGENYEKFRTMSALQVEKIKRDGMSISFEPRSIQYERQSDKVFVSGNSIVEAAGVKAPQSFTRVFEVVVEIKNGLPKISYIDTYQGQAKTRDILEKISREIDSTKRIDDEKDKAKLQSERDARKGSRETE